MIEQLPLDSYQLGQPLTEYKVRRFNNIGGPILTLIGLLFIIVSCQINRNLILLGIVGMLLLLFGLVITSFGFIKRNMRVVIFSGGFLYQLPKKTLIVPWQDIVFVHKLTIRNFINFIYAGKTYRYSIQTKDAECIVLDNTFDRIEELGDTIQTEVAHVSSVSTP